MSSSVYFFLFILPSTPCPLFPFSKGYVPPMALKQGMMQELLTGRIRLV